MVGFVAGLPFLYKLVPRERQLEVPKYVRPRTDTPKQTVGHGGCFGCIYSVRGAGGYQMFGITPLPIYQPAQRLPDLPTSSVLRTGRHRGFRPVTREDYDALKRRPTPGAARSAGAPSTFSLEEFEADPDGYNARLLEVLG